MMVVGILVGMAVLAGLGYVVHISIKEVQQRRPETTQVSLNVSFPEALRRELDDLPLSAEKKVRAARALAGVVDQEVSKKMNIVRNEIAQKYKEILETKEKAVTEVREKFETVSRDFQELGVAKKQTETVVRAISEGRVVVNEKGETLLMSPEVEKLLSVKKNDWLGKPVTQLRKKETVISFVNRFHDSEEESLASFSENFETERLIKGSSAVIETESGHTKGMISVLPDTAREKILDEYKNELIASFSHEMRTPLVCIQKSLETLLSGDMGNISDGQKEFLGIARRSTEKLERMVNEVLDFSRIEAGRVSLRLEVFPAKAMLAQIKQDFLPWSLDKEIAVSAECRDDGLILIADRQRLIQVLSNLMSNALKFSPRGGSVSVVAAPATPGEFFLPPDNLRYIHFAVKDSGPGISANDQGRLFEKFFRGSNPETLAVTGSGLGLAITKALVDLHGGRIWVESQMGSGSTFHFVIPQMSGEG